LAWPLRLKKGGETKISIEKEGFEGSGEGNVVDENLGGREKKKGGALWVRRAAPSQHP